MKDAEITKEDRELGEQLLLLRGCVLTLDIVTQTVANHRAKCAAQAEQEKLALEFRDKWRRPFGRFKDNVELEPYIKSGTGEAIITPHELQQLAAWLNTDMRIPHKDD